MDTKLKKSSEINPRALNKVFSKKLRITAFVLACVFCALTISSRLYECFAQSSYIYDEQDSYIDSQSYREEVMKMYEQLCITSACYINNVDTDFEFTGEKNLLSDYLYYLDSNSCSYKKTDDGIVLVSELFDYYVSFTEKTGETRYITNISIPDEVLSNDRQYRVVWLKNNLSSYLLRENNTITSDMASSNVSCCYQFPTAALIESYIEIFTGNVIEYDPYNYYYDDYFYIDREYWQKEYYPNNFLPIGGWYYDNYGRFSYSFGNDTPIVFYRDAENTDAGKIAREGSVEVFAYYDDDTQYSYYQSLEEMDDYYATDGDDSGITVFIAPKQEALAAIQTVYEKTQQKVKIAQVISACALAVTILLLIYTFAACGYTVTENGRGAWKKLEPFDRIYTEAFAAAAILILFVFANSFYSLYHATVNLFDGVTIAVQATFLIAASGIAAAELFALVGLVEGIKTKTFFKDSLFVRLFPRLKRIYLTSRLYTLRQKRSLGKKLTENLVVILCCAALLIPDGQSQLKAIIMIITLPIIVICTLQSIRAFRDLGRLSRQIESLVTDEAFDEVISPKSDVYNDSQTLMRISEKIKNSVEEQLKSERMKIELVANVSHDLKTPLTSIIGYIDLLKKLDLDGEAADYVKILDKKSQKLKGIVSDVFTIAKATSGIEVNLVKLDFVMLFNQALANAQDKIEQSGKIIKTSINETSAFVMADGDKLYRVFQNLLDNALRYSLDGSRIFLEIIRKNDTIMFVSKNVSLMPIDYTAQEITERFVRGDKSRTDGGSGLGLSIAKSFTEACGGEFVIELDADMFKAIVSMPIYDEEDADSPEEN